LNYIKLYLIFQDILNISFYMILNHENEIKKIKY